MFSQLGCWKCYFLGQTNYLLACVQTSHESRISRCILFRNEISCINNLAMLPVLAHAWLQRQWQPFKKRKSTLGECSWAKICFYLASKPGDRCHCCLISEQNEPRNLTFGLSFSSNKVYPGNLLKCVMGNVETPLYYYLLLCTQSCVAGTETILLHVHILSVVQKRIACTCCCCRGWGKR